jgi:hypothetical protein
MKSRLKITIGLILIGSLFLFSNLQKVESSEIQAGTNGVKCDGTTDDTSAIQSLLDSYDIVNLPDGVCIIEPIGTNDYALRLNDNNVLRGEGENTVLKRSNLVGSGYTIKAIDIDNIEISNLIVDGNGAISHGIRGENNLYFTVRDVTIKNGGGYGIGIEGGTNQYIYIQNVVIKDMGMDGIDFKNENSLNKHIFIDNVSIENVGGREGYSNQAAIDIRGIASVSNIQIFNMPTDTTGIRFRETTTEWGAGGEQSTLNGFTIIDDDMSYGVHLAASKVVVTNGNLKGTMDIGFWVANEFSNISNITLENVLTGFHVTSTARYSVIDDVIHRYGTRTVYTEADYGIFSDSISNGMSQTGMYIHANSDGTVINGNVFRSNAAGVFNYGTNTINSGNYGY